MGIRIKDISTTLSATPIANIATTYLEADHATSGSAKISPQIIIDHANQTGNMTNVAYKGQDNAFSIVQTFSSGLDGVIGAVTPAAGTFTTLNATNFVGAIDGVLGGVTPAAVSATTITGSGVLSIDDTTQSTSSITGSIHTDGGLGVAKDVFIDGSATIAGGLKNWSSPKGGYIFDGVDDYIDLGSTIDYAGTSKQFTIAVMIEPKNISSGTQAVIHHNPQIQIYIDATGVLTFYEWGTNKTLTTTTTLVNDTKYFITVTLDGSRVGKLYVNGILEDSDNYTGTIASATTNLFLGARQYNVDQHFDGNIYFAKFYNNALTQAEVTDLYNNGRPQDATIPYKYVGASQTAQTSGTLTIGKKYRINTFVAGDDFVNVGGTNVSGNEFVATGTTPTTWTNSSSLVKAGNVLDLQGTNATASTWYDASGNTLNGTTSGSPVVLSDEQVGNLTVNQTLDAKVIYSNTSTTSIPNATATTVFTLTDGEVGILLVYLDDNNPSVHSFAIVGKISINYMFNVLNEVSMTLSNSSGNIQVTHSLGSTLTFRATFLRMGD